MGGTNKKLTTAVETYLDDLRRIRASGGATGERSSYGPLANLLNAVGATLKPKVFCVGELADQGAGHPDFGLYTAKQVQRGRPREGQAPERGVVEVKSPHEDLRAPAVREQVVRYWGRYRLVLVTTCASSVSSVRPLTAARRCWSRSDWPRAKRRSPAGWSIRVHSRGRSARVWASISRAHCPTGPRSPSRRTWLGCSRPMPATVSRGSRRPVTRRR